MVDFIGLTRGEDRGGRRGRRRKPTGSVRSR